MRKFISTFRFNKNREKHSVAPKNNVFKKYVVISTKNERASFDTVVEASAHAGVSRTCFYKNMIDQHVFAYLIQRGRKIPKSQSGQTFIKFDDRMDYEHFLAGVVTVNKSRL